MTPKLPLPSLALLPVVVALGCAPRTSGSARVCTPAACAPKPRTVARVAAVVPAQPALPRTETGGVSLTGPDAPYLQRVDPSGWSGRSVPAESEPAESSGLAPTAVGGGPPAKPDSENEDAE